MKPPDPASFAAPLPTEAALVTVALERRSDVLAARNDLASAALEVRKQRGAYLPVVTFDASYLEQKSPFPADAYGSASINLSLPLFNSGETAAKVRAASQREVQARLALEATEQLLREEIRRALLDLDTAETSLTLAREQEVAAAAEHAETFALYQAQESTALEVRQAESSLAEARRALIESSLERDLARARVWHAAGSLGWHRARYLADQPRQCQRGRTMNPPLLTTTVFQPPFHGPIRPRPAARRPPVPNPPLPPWPRIATVAPALLLAGLALLTTACAEKLVAPPPAADAAAVPAELADLAKPTTPAPAPQPSASGAGAEPSHFVTNGELRSPMQSAVSVRVPGRVASVLVDEGELVRRGTPLLRLETDYAELEVSRARAELARAEAGAAEAERELARKQDLFARASVPPATRDRALAARDQAAASLAWSRAALATAERRLADTTLHAPFTGVVVSRQAAVGAFLDDKGSAFVLAETDPLRLRFDLPERLLARLQPGQTVRAGFDAYPGEIFDATVSLIAQAVDPTSRTVFVEAVLANGQARLRPGMFARVEISFDPPTPPTAGAATGNLAASPSN